MKTLWIQGKCPHDEGWLGYTSHRIPLWRTWETEDKRGLLPAAKCDTDKRKVNMTDVWSLPSVPHISGVRLSPVGQQGGVQPKKCQISTKAITQGESFKKGYIVINQVISSGNSTTKFKLGSWLACFIQTSPKYNFGIVCFWYFWKVVDVCMMIWALNLLTGWSWVTFSVF